MKSLQYFVALTMIVGLTGNPVKAADTERTHGGGRMQTNQKTIENTQPMKLSSAQMDEITAGRLDQIELELYTIKLGGLLEAGHISEQAYNYLIDMAWGNLWCCY